MKPGRSTIIVCIKYFLFGELPFLITKAKTDKLQNKPFIKTGII